MTRRLKLEDVQKDLSRFGKYVVQQSRSRLTRLGHNKTKDLYNSIGYKLNVSQNSFRLSFAMADYGKYQDLGVKGAEHSEKAPSSPFSYKLGGKKPPASAFEKWGKEHNVSPWAISHSIWSKGLKPTMFFTTPFNRAFEKFPDELVKQFGLDIDKFLQATLKDI
tara:strand:- start:86 stop:577 length:492 start_codon:yes stop_codon:yes gene_type:complete